MALRRSTDARSAQRAPRAPSGVRPFAKLTRPRLDAPYRRRRLFTILDGLRHRPIVWVAGPPGAGKTTLAATWLEARRVPGIWYQLDPADSDPATFFYYLKRAAEAAGVGDAPLPLLTVDYRHDVPAFARQWFRELFSSLPPGSVLVLDNYQELGADSPLHRVLAAASNEIPERAQLLILSWADPPAEFSRSITQERVARVDPDALRLTHDEAQGIAASSRDLTGEQIQALHAACGGWTAGFTLLRERTRRTGLVNRVDQHATMQEVFDYFMEQVFRDAPTESRQTLLETALLPRFTEAMAVEQTGNGGAGDLVESLYRRHLFVDRRPGTEVTYEYHALYRAFLLDQLRRQYTDAAVAELSARAARVLETAGWHEDALEVLLRGRDHDRAARLVERLAPGWVAAGRSALIEQAFDRISPLVRDARPALSYWRGTAIAYWRQPEARAAFERAYEGFLRDGDRAGQAMAATGVLWVLSMGWSNSMNELDTVRRWVAALESLLSDVLVFPSADVAVRAYAPLFILLVWHVPNSPLLPICREHLEGLLQQPVDDDDAKLNIATVLMQYYGIVGYVHEAERILVASEPLMRSPRVSPSMRAMWWFHSSWGPAAAGDLAGARARLANAVAIAAEDRLRGSEAAAYVHLWASFNLAGVVLDLGDLDAVESTIESLERAGAASAGQQATAAMRWIQARLAAARGNLDEALRQCEQASSLSGGAMILLATTIANSLMSILIERGELGRARELLDRNVRILPVDWAPIRAIRVDFLQGLLGPASDPGWRDRVVAAIRRVHTLGVEHPLPGQPLLTRQVAELLLSEGIEVPYVRAWIRHLHPRPSSPDIPNWPWAVRVRTLGAFRIEIDDSPLTFAGKAPRKPLQLLQALVAFGGEGVSSEAVCEALWPDSEGDAAETALRVTVSRLRALLKCDAVLLKDGKLSLERRLCWVDLWSFRELCRVVAARSAEPVTAPLLEIYRGPFLTNEREEPWMLPVREQLRRQFAEAVVTISARLERDGKANEADTLRRGARERDPLASV